MGLSDEALAFLMVVGAGLSTSLGAAVVYNTWLIRMTSRSVLGASLGLSAGVMLYVSFVEIFAKSLDAFEDAGNSPNNSYLFATLCFFGGVVSMKGIDFLVHMLDPADFHHEEIDFDMVEDMIHREDQEQEQSTVRAPTSEMELVDVYLRDQSVKAPAYADKPSSSIEEADDEGSAEQKANERSLSRTGFGSIPTDEEERSAESVAGEKSVQYTEAIREDSAADGLASEKQHLADISAKRKAVDKKLHRMGLLTALAIAIHNFPEGLATFVATLDDPAVGVPLGIAIAIHNIPEGLCVSVPIFFASGERHKAFLWGVLSGLSEIVAAGLGWIVLAHVFEEVVYALLFGFVSGMMVSICIYQLLPTARRYDPEDFYVSNAVVVGMMIMAISLVAFLY